MNLTSICFLPLFSPTLFCKSVSVPSLSRSVVKSYFLFHFGAFFCYFFAPFSFLLRLPLLVNSVFLILFCEMPSVLLWQHWGKIPPKSRPTFRRVSIREMHVFEIVRFASDGRRVRRGGQRSGRQGGEAGAQSSSQPALPAWLLVPSPPYCPPAKCFVDLCEVRVVPRPLWFIFLDGDLRFVDRSRV